MKYCSKQNTIEWAFLALLIIVCGILSVWQYQSTGEIARAEMVQLRNNLNEQAILLCHSFDRELSKSCELLQPNSSDVEKSDWRTIHGELLKKWIASDPRPIFKRLGIVINTEDGAQLHGLDLKTGEIKPMQWPSEWSAIQILHHSGKGGPHGKPFNETAFPPPMPFDSNLDIHEKGPPAEPMPFARGSHPKGLPFGGQSPFSDPSGTIFQVPIMNPSNPGGIEWMVFELDSDFLRNTWLPELITQHFTPKSRQFNDVEVKTTASPPIVIYNSEGVVGSNRGTPFSIQFNRQGHEDLGLPWPPCWVLNVWHRPGMLEAAISASRHRNFAIAVALNILILTAGYFLIRYTRRSRRLAEEQMSFVANISHELYTPLTVIRGAAHNLQRGVVRETSKIEHYAELIIQHAEQLTDMVEQVLMVAGAKKSRSDPPHRPVSIPQALQTAIAAAEHDTQANHCNVELQIEGSLPIVAGDEGALRRVFQNLIVNAAKHGGEAGWIGVSAGIIAGSEPPMVKIQVADHGPGIPQDELPEIFKPFFRGSNAQAKQIRGSGLGLSLVREIVEAHGGDIAVTSDPGNTTVFTVRLPVATQQSNEHTHPSR